MTPAIGVFANYALHAQLAPRPGMITQAFRATDTRTGMWVTLEIVPVAANSVDKARFGLRSRRLASLKHHALPPVVMVTQMYAAMEAPNGELLSEYAGVAIARARQKVAWLAQAAAGLSALHKGSLVHGHVTLDEMTVLPDGSVRLSVPLGGDIGARVTSDVRAFAQAACELFLGGSPTSESPKESEEAIAKQLHEAGVTSEAAAVVAQIRAGAPLTSEELARKLEPFAEYSGPTTERMLPVMPRRTRF